jgi:hypothetical protein
MAWLMLPTTAMTNNNDTAGPPLLHLDAIPVPARAEEPARAALAALQSRLLDEGMWAPRQRRPRRMMPVDMIRGRLDGF